MSEAPDGLPQRARVVIIGGGHNGLTAAADMGTNTDDWNVIRRAGDLGRLNVRILSYASGIDHLLAIAGRGPTP